MRSTEVARERTAIIAPASVPFDWEASLRLPPLTRRP